MNITSWLLGDLCFTINFVFLSLAWRKIASCLLEIGHTWNALLDVYLIMLTFPHEGMVCIHFRDIVLPQTTVSKFKLDPLEEA